MALIALIALLACAARVPARAEERDETMFKGWVRTANSGRFEKFLHSAGLDKVLPLHQLLRTASDWSKCGGPPFEIPPERQWPDVNNVLLLVKELKRRRLLAEFEAVSSYRNPSLNSCAGGAPNSAHARQFAIDLTLPAGKGDGPLLCEFWKAEGQSWNMGLSKYPSGRIHLDTAGYRTWGASHKHGTSFCVPPNG